VPVDDGPGRVGQGQPELGKPRVEGVVV